MPVPLPSPRLLFSMLPPQDSWSKTEAIVYVTAAQLLCGVAKDLVKLGGKTVR